MKLIYGLSLIMLGKLFESFWPMVCSNPCHQMVKLGKLCCALLLGLLHYIILMVSDS